ncbi:sulfatase family protein [Saccharicrinis aurantiacus]|uniref:sulfatase family protein n=1 Tax=Saccharicrinis aurantiacus TaxID=1849719 RepID=UPI00094FB85B|nr:arylsulfatase [Saccharicrinis aurantiacus]
MKLISMIKLAAIVLIMSACQNSATKKVAKKPNVIIIYVDDLGYGDIGCYGATGVKTPNLDAMAANGVRFTDAHCGSSTCTPSRYSLLTGEYAFRINAAVLEGDAPLLINPDSETMPDMFKKAGYTTGVVGKWHLGLGNGQLNWNEEVKPGPLEIGFDYSFLVPATGDRVPSVYLEDYKVVGLDPNDPITVSYDSQVGDWPTGKSNPELVKQLADPQHSGTITNGMSRIGFMHGGESAIWNDEEMPFVLDKKAKSFIKDNKENPFFLYYAYHDIHVPRMPNEKFLGKSSMGVRGDAIAQMDWCTGEIVKYLEELGIAENTLIIFSSDNGPILDDGYADQSVELLGGHKPGGAYRGGKYSTYEAGTRVPTITYWPGTVKPSTSNALLSHVDIYASLASLLNQNLENGASPDGENQIDAFLGKTTKGKSVMLEDCYNPGLRMGKWKFIPATKRKADWIANAKGIESGMVNEDQLFDVEADPAEQNNIAKDNAEIVTEMRAKLKAIKN